MDLGRTRSNRGTKTLFIDLDDLFIIGTVSDCVGSILRCRFYFKIIVAYAFNGPVVII